MLVLGTTGRWTAVSNFPRSRWTACYTPKYCLICKRVRIQTQS
uniref:Uncharacterized protein n=1 Tax=Arundo donax TaxID=35708 RepID=A0A0A9C078_ARUDO